MSKTEQINIPLVSILIPSYNHGRYLRECLKSILDQDYENFELIIVDDGSSDNSLEILNEYEAINAKIRVFSQKNQGVASALNKALNHAKGKYCCFMASDDTLIQGKIKTQVEFLETNPKFQVVSGNYKKVNEKSELIGEQIKHNQNKEILGDVFSGCLFHILTAMFSLRSIREVGGFRDGMNCEDWYLQIMLSKAGVRFFHIDQYFALYRIHDQSTHLQIESTIRKKNKLAKFFLDEERFKIEKAAIQHGLLLLAEHFSVLRYLIFSSRNIIQIIKYNVIYHFVKYLIFMIFKKAKEI